jgi:uracil-DNA glycosylase
MPVDPIQRHIAKLRACRLCPRMIPPSVPGRPVRSKVLLVGQAPGDKEPVLGRPFAWTAGKTLFKWFNAALGWTEAETRDRVYFAAVCRCFPGKKAEGGDRVPDEEEIANCMRWLEAEVALLEPQLVIAVGKLAMNQFLEPALLTERIGYVFPTEWRGHKFDVLPLPHPSGASPWHRVEPGKTLLAGALRQLAEHPAVRQIASE